MLPAEVCVHVLAAQQSFSLQHVYTLQVMEGVVSVVACLEETRQASTSRTLLEPVLQALQQQLQQLQHQQPQHANGVPQSPEGFEVISALMDRLGILFR